MLIAFEADEEIHSDDAKRDDAKRDDAKRDEAKRDDAKRDDAKRDDAKRDDAKRDDAVADDDELELRVETDEPSGKQASSTATPVPTPSAADDANELKLSSEVWSPASKQDAGTPAGRSTGTAASPTPTDESSIPFDEDDDGVEADDGIEADIEDDQESDADDDLQLASENHLTPPKTVRSHPPAEKDSIDDSELSLREDSQDGGKSQSVDQQNHGNTREQVTSRSAGPDDKTDDDDFKISDPVELPKYKAPPHRVESDLDEDMHADGLGKQAARAAASAVGAFKSSMKESAPTGKIGKKLTDSASEDHRAENDGAAPAVKDDIDRDFDHDFDHSGAKERVPLESKTAKVSRLQETYESETVWLKDMLAFIPDLHFVVYWICLTIMLTTALLVRNWAATLLAGDSNVASQAFGVLVVSAIFLPVSLAGLVALTLSGSNIFQQTAEGNKVMADWPSFDFFAWISRSLYYIVPAMYAVIPAVLVYYLSRSYAFSPWLVTVVTAVCMALLWPPFLLSVVRNVVMWNPYNSEVWSSFSRQPAIWKRFYRRTGILLLTFLVPAFIFLIPNVFAVVISAACLVFLLFVFMRVVGFLARDLFPILDEQAVAGASAESQSDGSQSDE